MATPDPTPPPLPPDAGIDEIRADIEQTRHQLGETVEALSDKLNVKEHARHKAVEIRAKSMPAVPIAIAVAVAAIVGIVVWRRRH
jgi:ElaB/YqjD/DUF883 family membrane-anchored ribosome-binding protein